MPKRIIDGEGLWHSHKLAQVSPSWMKAEYANLLPLALANGVFEYEPNLIWATVYAYNRPEITTTMVTEIFDEFERVGLVIRWQADAKTWVYLPGSNKPGRLPPPNRLKDRHERIGPYPPDFVMDTIGKPPASIGKPKVSLGFGFGFGFGLGSGLCVGAHTPRANHRLSEHAQEPPTELSEVAKTEVLLAAQWVCQELNLAGHKLVWMIHDVIRNELKHSTETPQTIAEMLVRIRRRYEAARHNGVVYNTASFFEKGIWRQSSLYEPENGSYHDSVLIDSRSYEPEKLDQPDKADHVYCANSLCGKHLGFGDPAQQFVCSHECAAKANLELEVFSE